MPHTAEVAAAAMTRQQGSSALQSSSAASLPTADLWARALQAGIPVDLTGALVSGKLQVGNIAVAPNMYDPANGVVPSSGYGNSQGPPLGPGPDNVPVDKDMTEFGVVFLAGTLRASLSVPTDIQPSGVITVKFQTDPGNQWNWAPITLTLTSPAFRAVTGYDLLLDTFTPAGYPVTTTLPPVGGDKIIINIPAGAGTNLDLTYSIQLVSEADIPRC